ncbi:MAG: Rho termination factor N-terminal domain-containing protein, partial [Nocardioides sp.]|uniref:Rho termination factor N-terminal domain-containing protein n=1 Tax=Nocardioides sp. TaxID=35761 RepID=UPI0032667430
MTESTDAPAASPAKKKSGGLNSMLLADLKSMAGGLGVSGAGSMKKAQLVEAIKAAQAGPTAPAAASTASTASAATAPTVTTRTRTPRTAPTRDAAPAPEDTKTEPAAAKSKAEPKAEVRAEVPAEKKADEPAVEQTNRQRTRNRQANQQDKQQDKPEQKPEQKQGGQQDKAEQKQPVEKQANQQTSQQGNQQGQNRSQQSQQAQHAEKQANQQGQQQAQQQGQQGQLDDFDDDGEGGSRRNRRRRGRDRDRQVGRVPGARNEPDTTVLEDDVLVPAAGILDVLDNYAFVRTSGYLPGTDDVYLSLSMVRKFGLRRGDAVVGQVRQPREGERKEKFNPMVRIDSVNGTDPEAARDRLEFETFTPVHPTERLRLETDAANLTGRVVDIAAPIVKGQRGLVVAPPKSGRTTLLQSAAQSISRNNPEVHLMVVLLDARPEEVTDFQRAVKGEVIASTFDRAASDHTMLAELAIERAKRLV